MMWAAQKTGLSPENVIVDGGDKEPIRDWSLSSTSLSSNGGSKQRLVDKELKKRIKNYHLELFPEERKGDEER